MVDILYAMSDAKECGKNICYIHFSIFYAFYPSVPSGFLMLFQTPLD